MGFLGLPSNSISRGRLVTGLLILLVPAVGFALLRAPRVRPAVSQAPVEKKPAANVTIDPIVDLQHKIDAGEVQLDYIAGRGYLDSVLKALKIPVSSQSLVFSKSSFQLFNISPDKPRAIYFNDNVYVGWVQAGLPLELASIDPKRGPVFYILEKEDNGHPRFIEQKQGDCVLCHNSAQGGDKPIPRMLMLSVLPDPTGSAIKAFSMVTNDQSPFRERWGGWYVTGTHGSQRHMGNMMVPRPDSVTVDEVKKYIARMDLSSGANVTDLHSRFDTKPYLSPDSDIVALLLLAHQTDVQNLMTLATYEVQDAIQGEPVPNKISDATRDLVKEDAELVVRVMLFSGAAPMTAPVAGTTSFASDFSSQGPRDSHGRSLRELDLKTRLFRYPMSYQIYSAEFDALPPLVKDAVYRRFWEILSGEDKTKEFAHLSDSDREAILGILRETKPDFTAFRK